MGMISKRIHQKTTNRIAAPIRAVTALDPDQVLSTVRKVIESTPAKSGLLKGGQKLWLFGSAPGPWEVYYGPPSKKEPGKVVRVWMASLSLKSSSAGDQTMVTIELQKWKTLDGKLVGRSDFERFRDTIGQRLSSLDPSYQLMTAPT